MQWEMIVQSTFIWANYLLPYSPYCMIYLWWETEREDWSWSLLGVKGLRLVHAYDAEVSPLRGGEVEHLSVFLSSSLLNQQNSIILKFSRITFSDEEQDEMVFPSQAMVFPTTDLQWHILAPNPVIHSWTWSITRCLCSLLYKKVPWSFRSYA